MSRDRPRPLELPEAAISDPKVKPAAEKYAELRQQEHVAADSLFREREARAKAMQADRQALADAKRAGKPDAGPAAVLAADAAIEAARRDLEALEIAVDDQRRELVATVAKQRVTWERRIHEQTRELRAAYAAAVESVAAAHEALATSTSLGLWLSGFPDVSRWRPSLVYVSSMRTAAGEPAAYDAILQALRDHASPAVPAPAAIAHGALRPARGAVPRYPSPMTSTGA